MAFFNIKLPWFNRPANQAGQSAFAPPVGSRNVEVLPEYSGLAELVPAMESDYQIQFAKYIIAANIASINVSISVENGDGSRSDAIQKSLMDLWSRSVESMQDSIGYGRVAFEEHWKYDERHSASVIKKLTPYSFASTRLNLAEDGSFDGFDLKTKNGKWESIPVDKSWWLALKPTAHEPHGRSQYLGAVHAAWRRKQVNIKNREKFSKRFAIRGGIAHVPMTETDEQTGEVISVPEKLAAALESLYSGGTLILPNDQHPTVDGKYKYDFAEANPESLDPAPIDSIIANDDIAILRAIGIPEKTVIEGQSAGSFAMVSQQILTLFARVESLFSEMVNSFQEFVVDKVQEANYGPGTTVFTIGYTKLTNRPDSLVGELLKILVANPQFASVIVSGGVDLRALLTTLGVSVTEEFESLVREAAVRFSATTGAVGGMPPGASGGDSVGEFSGISRRAWQNNRKAIEDVRKELAAGSITESYARTMLATLGLVGVAVDALIEDALDGSNDEPLDDVADGEDVKKKTLANKAVKAPSIPDWETIATEANKTLAQLWKQADEAVNNRDGFDESELRSIFEEIDQIRIQLGVAGRVIGLLSPWGRKGSSRIALANTSIGDFGFSFPWIDRAWDFLISKKVVKATDFKRLSKDAKRDVFTAPGIDSTKVLKELRKSIADSIKAGESLAAYRKKTAGAFALEKHQTETLFRTETKRAYVAGQDDSQKSEAVKEAFPAVLFSSTPDTRVRDEHWELDGFCCLTSDPAYKVLRKAVSDWNCRCSMIPITSDDADSYGGLKTYSDLPASVVRKYG